MIDVFFAFFSKINTVRFINFVRYFIITLCMEVMSIQKSKNHQRRIFLDNYYRQRCLV
jgi:hypothetical protein